MPATLDRVLTGALHDAAHPFVGAPDDFDPLLLHYDTTHAVEPLERTAVWERRELAETYPSAL